MDVQVEPWTRVCDSVRFIMDKIKLSDRAGFGIFQVGIGANVGATADSKDEKKGPAVAEGREGREMWVPLNSCLLDYDPQHRPTISPVLYRQQAARMVFKRRLYQDLVSQDKLAQQLLYYQTMVSLCDESLPTNEKTMVKFLALHRLIDEQLKPQPIGVGNMLASSAVKNLLPSATENYNQVKKDAYLDKIRKAKEELVAAKKKVKYVDLTDEVRDWQLFGCVYFSGKYYVDPLLPDAKKKEAEVPKALSIGISSQGVFLVHGRDKKVWEELPFFRIQSFALVDNTEFSITVRNKEKFLKHKSQVHRFKSNESEEIIGLLTTIQEDINRQKEEELSADTDF